MNKRIVRHLTTYRQMLITEYGALVEREKRDHDDDAGEEAKRLIKDIQELKSLIRRMSSRE